MSQDQERRVIIRGDFSKRAGSLPAALVEARRVAWYTVQTATVGRRMEALIHAQPAGYYDLHF